MTASDRREIEAWYYGAARMGMPITTARNVARLAGRIWRRAELLCSVDLPERELARQNREDDRDEKRLAELLIGYDVERGALGSVRVNGAFVGVRGMTAGEIDRIDAWARACKRRAA